VCRAMFGGLNFPTSPGFIDATSNSILPPAVSCHSGVDCDGGDAGDCADWASAHGNVDETAIAATNAPWEIRLHKEFHEKLRSRGTSISTNGISLSRETTQNKDAETAGLARSFSGMGRQDWSLFPPPCKAF
jgi:hypothetical protein